MVLGRPVDKTTRQVNEEKTTGQCMACHRYMNPLGFLLESYDGLGRYRTEELRFGEAGEVANQLPIDSTAVGMLYDGDEEMLDGAVALADRIAKGGKGQIVLARNFFRFANARIEDDNHADDCALEAMWKWAFASDGSMLDMARESTRSPSFRVRLGPP